MRSHIKLTDPDAGGGKLVLFTQAIVMLESVVVGERPDNSPICLSIITLSCGRGQRVTETVDEILALMDH